MGPARGGIPRAGRPRNGCPKSAETGTGDRCSGVPRCWRNSGPLAPWHHGPCARPAPHRMREATRTPDITADLPCRIRRAVRAKDLHDGARILEFRPATETAFLRGAANEFRLVCGSRYVDCHGPETFHEEWRATRQSFVPERSQPLHHPCRRWKPLSRRSPPAPRLLAHSRVHSPLPEQSGGLQTVTAPHFQVRETGSTMRATTSLVFELTILTWTASTVVGASKKNQPSDLPLPLP